MGGTFDPIHNQHLFIANSALNKLDLDIVLFIPTGKTPHKNNEFVTDKIDRFNMVTLAINDNEKFFNSDIEINSNETCYTVNTLKKLKELTTKDACFYFIIGIDTLYSLHTWRNIEELSSLCKLVAFNRPNYKQNEKSLEVIQKYNLDVIVIEDFSMDLSSSIVREKLFENEDVKYLVPSCVCDYIKKNDLYSKIYTDDFIDKLKKDLEKNISPKRLTHTLGVVEFSTQLADIYNINKSHCVVASLLHDFAKELSLEEKQKIINKYNIYIDDYTKNNLELSHGLLAKYIARDIYNIKDEDILNAIHYHTTGRPNMSTLEKIIFLADALEPNRIYADRERLVQLALTNLDLAVFECLKGKIEFTNKKGLIEHPLSIITYDYYYEKKSNLL